MVTKEPHQLELVIVLEKTICLNFTNYNLRKHLLHQITSHQFWKKMSLRQVVVWTKSHRPLFFTIGFSFGCCQTRRKIQILILLAFNDSRENAAFTFFTFSEAQSGIKTQKKPKEIKMKNVKVNDFGLCIFTAHEKTNLHFFPFFCKFPNFRGKMKTSDGFQRNSSTSPGCKNYSPIAKNNSAIGSWYFYTLAGLTKVGRIF